MTRPSGTRGNDWDAFRHSEPIDEEFRLALRESHAGRRHCIDTAEAER